MAPRARFSGPSLQELLLTARTGADRGGGAIRAATQGVQSAFNRKNTLDQQKLKEEIERRGQELQAQKLTQDRQLGQDRIAATEEQTAVTERSSERAAGTAVKQIKSQEKLVSSKTELNIARAKFFSAGKPKPPKPPLTNVEIEVKAEEQTNKQMKELANEIKSLSSAEQGSFRAKLKESAILALTTARDRDLAKEERVTIITEQNIPQTLPASQVERYLLAFPGARRAD